MNFYKLIIYGAAIVGGMCFARYTKTRYEKENQKWNIKEHLSYWKDSWFILFIFFTGLFEILLALPRSPKHTLQMIISLGFSTFFLLTCYYLLLMIFLPIIRKKVHSRTCAMLWILPLYMYILFFDFQSSEAPILIIPFSETGIWLLFGIWATGFVAVFAWKIISHLKYRSYVLRNAVLVKDAEILEPWRKELYDMDIKKPLFELVISPNVSTPMTIGLLRRSMKVVLPDRLYSREELELIYKHELTHIARNDQWVKLFLTFCSAVCWFNPLMWIAMRKCTEDLELSCDETVLIHADDMQKRQYAQLILKTAGDERGFTTCLSVKAKSLHYRLTNVLNKQLKYSGAILAGVIFTVLILSDKHIAFAYGYTTGKEILFENKSIESYNLELVQIFDSDNSVVCNDPAALISYLEKLPICEITSDYTFVEDSLFTKTYQLGISYDVHGQHYYLKFSDKVLYMHTYSLGDVSSYFDRKYEPYHYYLPSGVDFDYLYSLLDI